MRSRLIGVLCAVAWILGAPQRARACSMCRCGDPTFNALGAEIYPMDPWRLALDWDRYEKEQGLTLEEGATGPAGHEALDEQRVTAIVSYTLAERVNLVARVPYSFRTLTEHAAAPGAPDAHAGATDTEGFSDPEVYGLARLWSTPFAPGLGRRAWISGLAGVKAPWGRNHLSRDGARLDEHAQSGTGSTDVFAGVSGVYVLTPRATLMSSVQYRRMGRNDFGYRYGNLAMGSVGLERKLNNWLDGVLELDYRHAEQDRIDATNTLDPNTGGGVLYVTPRVMAAVGRGLVARLALQIPALTSLDGDQTEKVVANVGFTYLLR